MTPPAYSFASKENRRLQAVLALFRGERAAAMLAAISFPPAGEEDGKQALVRPAGGHVPDFKRMSHIGGAEKAGGITFVNRLERLVAGGGIGPICRT
jgi:hypothetical protein